MQSAVPGDYLRPDAGDNNSPLGRHRILVDQEAPWGTWVHRGRGPPDHSDSPSQAAALAGEDRADDEGSYRRIFGDGLEDQAAAWA